jgi:5'-3' exonuclease
MNPQQDTKKHVLLVDFNNIFHQAHSPWTQSNPNESNNAVIFNFLNVITSTYKNMEATHLVFCFEGRPEFRKALYPSYKANRKKDKDLPVYTHFYRQIEWMQKNIHQLIRCTSMRHLNLESDDCIYEACHRISSALYNEDDVITIISADKDLIQCLDIDPRIKLYSSVGKSYRERQDNFLMIKSLAGDSSDNIHGIARVGEVRAKQIIEGGIDKWLNEALELHCDIFRRNMKICKLYRWKEYEEYVSTHMADSEISQLTENAQHIFMSDSNYYHNCIKAFGDLGIKDPKMIEKVINMNMSLRVMPV